MSLMTEYTLKCDMCGKTMKLDGKSHIDVWKRNVPVEGSGDIHYELLDLCPQCFIGIALVPNMVDGETRYKRREA